MGKNVARKESGCQCKSCQSRCESAPGWFRPGEIEKAAKHLGLTIKTFFEKYVSVDWWFADADKSFDKNVFTLSPAIIGIKAGKVFEYSNRYGQCVFYKDGKCQIHAVKPFECRVIFHDTPEEEGEAIHRKVTREWDKNTNQEQIKKLIEKTPEIPDEWMIPRESDGGMFPWLP